MICKMDVPGESIPEYAVLMVVHDIRLAKALSDINSFAFIPSNSACLQTLRSSSSESKTMLGSVVMSKEAAEAEYLRQRKLGHPWIID